METVIYNIKGEKKGTIALPARVFDVKVKADVMHQVVVSLQENARAGTAHTKFRGEVRGGGKKPWRQKGTGRARHGSTRSPIWVGGGMTHGPRSEKVYSKKINKKTLVKALFGALSKKLYDGEVVFIDAIAWKTPSTKTAHAALTAIAKTAELPRMANSKKKSTLLLLPASDTGVVRSFRNIASVDVEQWRNLNPLMALSYKYLVFVNPEDAVAFFESKVASKAPKAKTAK